MVMGKIYFWEIQRPSKTVATASLQ